jgi:hypothetical protein
MYLVGQAFDTYSTILSDDFGFEAALRFRPRMKRAQIRSSTLEIINMRTMNRAQLDKLTGDHMYEVIDDVEGVLRTFTDDVR